MIHINREVKRLKIYNTLTRKKEEFVPQVSGKVSIYDCGPTVYNYIHIGNARPICVRDVLRRYLDYIGFDVTYVQNFTDIDDKIINRANDEGVGFLDIANRYIEEFFTDSKGLGIKKADYHPRATDVVEEIIETITALINKGYAYPLEGSVYYRTRKFEEYGKLSHMPLEELEAGARVDMNDPKEDPLDFVLWKNAKPGEPYWESPWGKGRPGWHIECSAMIKKTLGDTIDIHCAGSDLIFPHNENEIAQSEALSGKPYANYWMHNAMINVDSKKMSKSAGNFFTVRDIQERYSYEAIRFFMISAHYRSPVNFTDVGMEAAMTSLERLYTARENLEYAIENATDGTVDDSFTAAVDGHKADFLTAMDDDLNTADALAALFNLTREINSKIATITQADKKSLTHALEIFDMFCSVLGLLYNRTEKGSLDSEVEALIEQRQRARASKDFKTADEIRDKLAAMGITLLDTPEGVRWKKD